jgi:hypothetical protein
MKKADAVRLEIGATEQELHDHEQRGAELRQRLGRALIEARDHPEMTLEEGRQVPEREILRARANRLIREAGTANAPG